MLNAKLNLREMTNGVLKTFAVTMLFIGCQPNKQTELKTDPTDSIQQEAIQEKAAIPDTTTSEDKDVDYSDCIRGQADAVIKQTVYPNALFKLDQNNHTGTETVTFDNGEKLVIRNWGCEYYVLTFRFETSRFKADTTDVKYWLDKATVLMNEIQNGLDAPLNIPGGTNAILNHLRENKAYELREEIDYNEGFIRDFVTLDRIQKINDVMYAIEISYTTGPL